MKIAEALTESKRLGNLVPTLLSHFQDNCIIINGVKPDRDPDKIMAKVYAAIASKAEFDKKISLTNTSVKLPIGLTIHEAILRKAELKQIISSATSMHNALRTGKRSSYNEDKTQVKTYAVKPDMVEAQANEAAKELRQIESQLQQMNWVQDLV